MEGRCKLVTGTKTKGVFSLDETLKMKIEKFKKAHGKFTDLKGSRGIAHGSGTSLGDPAGLQILKHFPNAAMVKVLLEKKDGLLEFAAHEILEHKISYTHVKDDPVGVGLGGTGDSGVFGDTALYEGFTIGANDADYDDRTFQRTEEDVYDSPYTYALVGFADRFLMDPSTYEMNSLSHPRCESIELTGLTDAGSIQEVQAKTADFMGTPYTYTVRPASAFAAVYKFHHLEKACSDVFDLEKDMGDQFTISAKVAAFAGSQLQSTDSLPFMVSPCAKVGVHGFLRQTADASISFDNGETQFSTPQLEATPVQLGIKMYNKYGQLCSSHGDHLKIEVLGDKAKVFKAYFAVKHNLKALCATDSNSIDSLLGSLRTLAAGDRVGHNVSDKPVKTPEVEEGDAADGYEVWYKHHCISLKHAKTKSCDGKTLIHIIVEPHSSVVGEGDPAPRDEPHPPPPGPGGLDESDAITNKIA